MSNINDLAQVYVKSTIEYPHLKVITLAQWLLESGRGTSILAVEHKNFGGLKWRDEMKGFAVPVEYEAHDGKDSYCKFESYDKFIEGYWHFLDRSPYKGWRDHSQDPVDFISFIGKIYCPGNPQYSSSIVDLKDEAIAILKKAGHSPSTARVAIEIGHGPTYNDYHQPIFDPGTEGPGVWEYDENRFRAKMIADILRRHSIEVEIIDPRDNLINIGAMAEGFDVFVSLHLNSCDEHNAQGTETFIHRNHGEDDKKLAEAIQRNLVDILKLNDRGVKSCGFSVLVKSTPVSAACLSEAFFIDSIENADEVRKMSISSSEAIARGILEYLNINVATTVPESKKLIAITKPLKDESMKLGNITIDGTASSPIDYIDLYAEGKHFIGKGPVKDGKWSFSREFSRGGKRTLIARGFAGPESTEVVSSYSVDFNLGSPLVEIAKDCLRDGFKPDVLPGCANFVTHCLVKAGWKHGVISWVPKVVEICKRVKEGDEKPGDLVIFMKTYDANDDKVIDMKDDKSHIGILIEDNRFIHYSRNQVKENELDEYWKEHLQFFIRAPGI
ncbi:MAG: N-acetylmuramoyl-L-alanine amidase [Vulcanimicrobiota bacterium]